MEKRKVEVIAYDPMWHSLFNDESKRLRVIFIDNLVNIHHIGSTSIPNMSAKPVIDLLIEVKNISEVDELNDEMTELGYIPKGENGIAERRFFLKGVIERSHHVHVFPHQHQEVKRHLDFRDYMIAHPEEAKDYANLKEKLAKKYPEDIQSYIEGKDAFIKEIDKRASEWRSPQ
ncbi:GrpB family protein [Bacillus solimangrovi]|nr:GrpB family protein [Bacillus solimangrovi]